MVVEYPIYKNLLFGCLAKHVALQDASATGMHLIKIYTKKRNRLQIFKLNF
jgi:hypothetical protein